MTSTITPFPISANFSSTNPTQSTLRDGTDEMEVRLQVDPDGGSCVHAGDSQYDTDHRGFWGYGFLTLSTNCTELAKEMVEEAREHAGVV